MNSLTKVGLTLSITLSMLSLISCGSSSNSSVVGAAGPSNISATSGSLNNGSSLTISGSDFGTKADAKPLFYWKADSGQNPTNMGRNAFWSSGFSGSASTAVVAPGSSMSFGLDHTSSGAALGAVAFASDRAYMYRKTYEDFDITKDFGIRTRFSNLNGSLQIGDTITGQSSGATGTVQSVGDGIMYSNVGGSINAAIPTDFINGETMTTSSGGSMSNSEGVGTFRTFNFKTTRWWSSTGGGKNNIHLNAQGTDTNPGFRITPENTGGTLGNQFFLNPLFQLAEVWKTEEVVYQSSSLNTSDGLWFFVQNGVLGNDNTFTTRNSTQPNRYALIFQSQVSNGAQPGSVMYYDSLYVDDSWHRVIICNTNTYAACRDAEIQIPTAWSNTSITVEVNLGGYSSSPAGLFLYVFNGEGVPNENGFPL